VIDVCERNIYIYICMYVYIERESEREREKERNRETEREKEGETEKREKKKDFEREGPSKKSPSRARDNFEPTESIVFFFSSTAAATTTPTLSGDRAIRLVLGSCPYHGTSHLALSLRGRALPMAASGSESTPAVA
jgi:hypothetical protein